MIYRVALLCLLLASSGCTEDKDVCEGCLRQGDLPYTVTDSLDLDGALRDIIQNRGLTGYVLLDGRAEPVFPADSELVRLGRELFFSKSLSLEFDTACASCHMPDGNLSGGDGLSLSVGVAAIDPNKVGPGRMVNSGLDGDPNADGLPNVPRNSQSIINSVLYRKVLFWDGRVQRFQGGILTPDSVDAVDPNAGQSLLMAQAKFPLASHNEMRGHGQVDLATGDQVRDYLAKRLRGEVDTHRISTGDAARWLGIFQSAATEAGWEGEQPEELITSSNISRALAAYEESLLFVNNRWIDYVRNGRNSALTQDEKMGALLFFTELNQPIFPDMPTGKIGLGCAHCHAGEFFSDEQFHNAGFPQIGRGKRPTGEDFGRYLVTQRFSDMYRFRTPGLFNIMTSEPYGHAGSFENISDLLDYHVDPLSSINIYDFSLLGLNQFNGEMRSECDSGDMLPYCDAPLFTSLAQSHSSFSEALERLPGRPLNVDEKYQLQAFLGALTDPCVIDSSCLSPWVPASSDDPDGNLLVAGQPSPDELTVTQPPVPPIGSSPATEVNFPVGLHLITRFSEAADRCSQDTSVGSGGGGRQAFTPLDSSIIGISAPHGFDLETWRASPDATLQAGAVAATYLDDDCWADIIFSGGDKSGVVAYLNNSNGTFSANSGLLPDGLGGKHASIGVADINGDFRREIFLGNLMAGSVQVLSQNTAGSYALAALLPMGRNTFGFAFGAFDDSRAGYSYPSVVLSHWDLYGVPGSSPVLLKNVDGKKLYPADQEFGLSTSDGLSQFFTFSPAIADFNMDGFQDIVIASDFNTSVVLQNVPSGSGQLRKFRDVTDREIIKDQNGMGSVVADLDNDGDLDWFVTSIAYKDQDDEFFKGSLGNRLYRNESTIENVLFSDVTNTAGVSDGGWAWGACAADFNNDGWKDIFHENGYSYYPEEIYNAATEGEKWQIDQQRSMNSSFISTPAKLFINGKDGSFSERSSQWGIDGHTNGRGVVCFDYDRDGDVDILVLDHSKGLKLYRNEVGSGDGFHFISIRLIGKSPNTEALGAKVYVTANVSGGGDVVQMEQVGANSNFASQNTPDLHFGLGVSASASIKVDWPSGESSQYLVDANSFVILEHP